MSEYMIFDDVTLTGPIVCEDLKILRNFVTRGNNRLLPLAAGRRALPVVRDELDVTLTWFVRGTPNVLGVHQDPEEGIVENLEFYRNLFCSAGSATSEHDIEVHLADFVFTGSVQVVEYAEPTTGPQSATILTRIRVPSGQLTATAS